MVEYGSDGVLECWNAEFSVLRPFQHLNAPILPRSVTPSQLYGLLQATGINARSGQIKIVERIPCQYV